MLNDHNHKWDNNSWDNSNTIPNHSLTHSFIHSFIHPSLIIFTFAHSPRTVFIPALNPSLNEGDDEKEEGLKYESLLNFFLLFMDS